MPRIRFLKSPIWIIGDPHLKEAYAIFPCVSTDTSQYVRNNCARLACAVVIDHSFLCRFHLFLFIGLRRQRGAESKVSEPCLALGILPKSITVSSDSDHHSQSAVPAASSLPGQLARGLHRYTRPPLASTSFRSPDSTPLQRTPLSVASQTVADSST